MLAHLYARLVSVKRTTLLLDTDLMAEAAAVLGTTRPTDTVRASLQQAVRRAHLRRLTEWVLPDTALEVLEEQRARRRFDD